MGIRNSVTRIAILVGDGRPITKQARKSHTHPPTPNKYTTLLSYPMRTISEVKGGCDISKSGPMPMKHLAPNQPIPHHKKRPVQLPKNRPVSLVSDPNIQKHPPGVRSRIRAARTPTVGKVPKRPPPSCITDKSPHHVCTFRKCLSINPCRCNANGA